MGFIIQKKTFEIQKKRFVLTKKTIQKLNFGSIFDATVTFD